MPDGIKLNFGNERLPTVPLIAANMHKSLTLNVDDLNLPATTSAEPSVEPSAPSVEPSASAAAADSAYSAIAPTKASSEGKSTRSALGFHEIKSTSHITKLTSAQAAELLHRRSHAGVDKLRATAHTTVDAPRVLASASAIACQGCTEARIIKRTSHSGSLSAPSPEPGVLHVDLKEMIVSMQGYRYVVFGIDEYTRFIFVDFIKSKSEAADSINSCA